MEYIQKCRVKKDGKIYIEKIEIPEGMKRCCICKDIKNNIEFYDNKHARDGKVSECKPCRNKRTARWNLRRRRESIAVRQKNKKYDYWRRIHVIVWRAKQKGILKPTNCVI